MMTGGQLQQWGRGGWWWVAVGCLAVSAALTARGDAMAVLTRRARQACAEVLVEGRHLGSAWLASDSGLVLTAGHLFEQRGRGVELLFGDNQRAKARLVALDRGHDLALLQLEDSPTEALQREPLAIAKHAAKVGEEIHQYGAPIFRAGLLQPGRVAATGTVFEFQSAVVDYSEVVPVAAMMQGGTSGGPWLDRSGRVVGVQSSVMSLEGRAVGVAFMAPVEAIRRLLASGRDAETSSIGLGVDELWQQSKEYLARLPAGAGGLVVSVVREGGPAGVAGVQVQDLVTELEGRPLVRIGDLVREVRRHRPGQMVQGKVLRPGDRWVHTVRIVLERVEERWKP